MKRKLFWLAPLIALVAQLIPLSISDYLYAMELQEEYGEVIAWSPSMILSVAGIYALIALPISYLYLLWVKRSRPEMKRWLWVPWLAVWVLSVLFLSLVPDTTQTNTLGGHLAMVSYFELPYMAVLLSLVYLSESKWILKIK